MFKKFIGITSVAVLAALSSSPAFADNKAQEIIDSPAYSSFFKNYDDYLSGQKDIVKNNSIKRTDDGTIIYSFAQGKKLNVDKDVVNSDQITSGHVDFINTITDSYNNAYSKGYYKTQAQVNIHLKDNATYSFYNASEIKKQFEEDKKIIAHNDKVQEEVNALTKNLEDYTEKFLDKEDATYEQASSSAEYQAIIGKINAKSSELKVSKASIVSREFLNIEKNQDLFDQKINPSQIFVFGNPNEVDHKNYMFSKAEAKKGLEQCSTVLSVDKNGDQVSLLPSSIDKSGMVFGSVEEKRLFYKFVLLHELSHCEFSTNETTKFKKYSLGNAEVDQVVNDLFNSANASRYNNPFNRHFQEHYADVYASMILLREESNTELVTNVLNKITSLRSIGAVDGDYEHLTTYSLEQLKHPEIMAKVKSLPIDKLPDLAMEMSEKGVALTLATSTDFQTYLNKQVSKGFQINVLKALTKAVDGTTFNSDSYHENGLGDKNNTISYHADKLVDLINKKMAEDPNLRSETKLFLASKAESFDSSVKTPSPIKNFEYSTTTIDFHAALFLSSIKIADDYMSGHKNFNQLGENLKSSLQKSSFEPTISISVASLANSLTNAQPKVDDLSPSSLPKDINSFVLKTSLDKNSLQQKIEEVTQKALESRNQFLNDKNNIKVNKL